MVIINLLFHKKFVSTLNVKKIILTAIVTFIFAFGISFLVLTKKSSDNHVTETITKNDRTIEHKRTGKEFSLTSLKNGINMVDLIGAGTKEDLVMVARRNDGTSPHGYTNYSFFTGKNSENETYLRLVQLQNKDEDKLEDTISTSEGADCILQDIALINFKKSNPILVIAHRDLGKSYVDRQTVRFDFYQIKSNDTMDYMPDNWFQYVDSSETKEKYCDVNEAISKELKFLF